MTSRACLYIHVKEATHFLSWELPLWAEHFDLVPAPGPDVHVVAFGPDVIFEASEMPARARFAVLFPGFGLNPVHNHPLRHRQLETLSSRYSEAFINRGPLEIAYRELDNIRIFPFSVDTGRIPFRPRTRLDSVLHASADFPQKDVARNVAVLRATGLPFEVFPPRPRKFFGENPLGRRLDDAGHAATAFARGKWQRFTGGIGHPAYRSHEELIRRYLAHDAFVHVAADIGHPLYLDGKYTATLAEAALSGALIFWHDTFGLGNQFSTVFDVPKDPAAAAAEIRAARTGIDIETHSRATREEFLFAFDPRRSLVARADVINEY